MNTVVREEIDRATAGLALAVVLTVLALVLPWWTSSASMGSGDGVAMATSAGPFDTGGGLIEDWEATLVGVLTVGALAGFLVGFLVMWGVLELHPAWEARVPAIVYGSGVLLAVALVVAVVAWPGDAGFWNEASFFGATADQGADLGWYAALVGAILGPAAAWDARKRARISGVEGDPSPGPGSVT